MCGIAGSVSWRGARVGYNDIARSLAALSPRGPDGEGVETSASGLATLWHRRLAIVDLSPTGRQPMVSDDGRYTLVANGEIYNQLDIRRSLESLGHVFAGHCDSEVLLHGFREWGADLVPRLDGIFAFGIWDDEDRTLFLARDRMGVKPLYYTRAEGRVSFASTADALTGHDFAPDHAAWAHYWVYGYFDHESSAYAGVHKLPPGHTILLDASGATTQRFFSVTPAPDASLSTSDWVDAIDEGLQQSVADQLMSDVPTGVFLSGGIDSGLLCALSAAASDRPITAFSLGFAEADDEIALARITAAHAGVEHHVQRIAPDDAVARLADIAAAYDEPLADTSCIPTYFVSALARRHDVPVILSGDGGDELFAGYRRYPQMLSQLHRRWPVGRISTTLDRYAIGFRHARMMKITPYVWLRRVMSGPTLSRLLTPLHAAQMPKGVHPGLGFQLSDIRRYLPLDLLTKVDRASMAHGIEARVPFLSNRLIDLAFRVPPAHNHGTGQTKPLLRAVAERHLPPAVCRAPKEGFALPFDGLFAGLKKTVTRGLRGASVLVDEGLLSHNAYQAGLAHGNPSLNWAVALAELWARRHLRNVSADDVTEALCA